MELLKNGIPVNPASLSGWDALGVAIVSDIYGAKSFEIAAGGHLRQELNFTNTALGTTRFRYVAKSSSSENYPTLLIECWAGADRVHSDFYVPPTEGGYASFAVNQDIETLIVSRLVLTINAYTDPLYLSSVSLVSDVATIQTSYSSEKFQDKVILYGLDIDKPKLR